MNDEIEIEILEDGTIKFSTNKISGPNHTNAEKFLLDTGKLAGGKSERRKKPGSKHSHGDHHHHHGPGGHTHD